MSDEYQSIPVAVARAAVQASGELEGLEGPYYAVGDEPALQVGSWWRAAFRASGEVPHPDFAKVIVTRKGQKPREVVISWDEYAEQMDADPEWDAIREKKPMSVFGAEVERHAYRVVFADVLAAAIPPRIIVGEVTEPPKQSGRMMVIPDPEPTRDWRAEVAEADAGKLDALLDEARAAGAIAADPDLQGAFMDRLLQLEAGPAPTPAAVPSKKQAPRPQGQGNRRRGKR